MALRSYEKFFTPLDYFCNNVYTVWASLVAQPVKSLPEMRGLPGLIPKLGRSPGGRHGNSLQYTCLEKSHGERSLGGYSLWGDKELC